MESILDEFNLKIRRLNEITVACLFMCCILCDDSQYELHFPLFEGDNVYVIVWLIIFDSIMDNGVSWGRDMDDAVLFNGCMINHEIVFNANMNELRPLSGDGECVILNAPTARCLLLLLQNSGKVISRDEFLAAVWENRGVVVSQNTFYQNISLLRKSLLKAGLSEDIIITVRQKGFSVAPDTLIIPLSDEECENMNRVTLTHYKNNKVADVITESREHSDDHLGILLTENSAIQSDNLIENKAEIAGKESERLHVNFKVPTWLIALIMVMIVINIIVLVVLHR